MTAQVSGLVVEGDCAVGTEVEAEPFGWWWLSGDNIRKKLGHLRQPGQLWERAAEGRTRSRDWPDEAPEVDERVCPVCGAYGLQWCSTKSGRDHAKRARLGWTQ